MVLSEAALTFPLAVYSLSIDHPGCPLFTKSILKGFKAYTKGLQNACQFTWYDFMSVFVSLTPRLTESTKWALNESHISKLFFLRRPPVRAFQTFWIQISKLSSSIHPLGWQWTTTPAGNFSFGMVFHLKITMGFNFAPSARHDRTTVKRDFSWPVVLKQFFLHERSEFKEPKACQTKLGCHPHFQYGQVRNFLL